MFSFFACQNTSDKAPQAQVPGDTVTEDELYITQQYVDSLDKNRKQKLVDLRRELGFDCVELVDGDYVNLKIKVYPDGSYSEVKVLEKEDVDIEHIRSCINTYFEKNKKLNLGMLKDLPGSGKTSNTHPHVYTLLLY